MVCHLLCTGLSSYKEPSWSYLIGHMSLPLLQFHQHRLPIAEFCIHISHKNLLNLQKSSKFLGKIMQNYIEPFVDLRRTLHNLALICRIRHSFAEFHVTSFYLMLHNRQRAIRVKINCPKRSIMLNRSAKKVSHLTRYPNGYFKLIIFFLQN